MNDVAALPETTGTPGQRLKAERERRGLSLQKAADDMHLDAWVIEALEAGDYQRIGPAVYAKGHLKKYASNLGLPAADMLAAFEARPAPAAPSAPPASVRLRDVAPAAQDLPWPRIAVGALIALIVLGVLWWRPWHPRAEQSPAPQTDTAAAAGAAGVAATTAQDADKAGTVAGDDAVPGGAGSEAQVSVPGTTAAQNVAAPAHAAAPPVHAAAADADALQGVGRAHLRLSFSADSWVDVHDAAGRRVFAGRGRANSVRKISGSAPMRIYLGFASGVQLEINDRAVAIGPQFVAGDVAHFEAGADGVLRRDPNAVPAHGASAANPRPRG